MPSANGILAPVPGVSNLQPIPFEMVSLPSSQLVPSDRSPGAYVALEYAL